MGSAQLGACNFHATHTDTHGGRVWVTRARAPGVHTCGTSEAEGAPPPPGPGLAPGSAPVPRQLQCSKPVTATNAARKPSLPTHAHRLGGHIRTRWAPDKLTYGYIHALQAPSHS